jgi:two-component SAPR family response regulator
MNIFVVENCPEKSARALPDKLIVKMPLESAQMLCTAHRELDGDEYADKVGLYKRAYWNHPCTVWARESWDNYQWLYKHFIALGDEYKHRYGREHASITKLKDALYFHPDNIEDKGLTPLAQAMPDQYKDDDPIKAYRDYCINEKHYAKWEKGTEKPEWWK